MLNSRWCRPNLLAAALLVLTVTLFPALASAVEYGTPQKIGTLSDSPNELLTYDINNKGWVVWEEHSGSDWDIYLYKGSGDPKKISNNSLYNHHPQINDNGWVVWSGFDGSDYEIYLYKGSGDPQPISNSSWDDVYSAINDNGSVVWEAAGEIYLFTGSGDPQNISNTSSVDDHYAKISDNGWVVWEGRNGSDVELYLYKGSGDPQPISKHTYVQSGWGGDFQINEDGRIVWRGLDGNEDGIYLYKGSGDPKKISKNTLYNDFPQINDEGWVVWYGSPENENSAIYLYKGSGDPKKILDNSLGYMIFPHINDDGFIASLGTVYLSGDDYTEVYLFTGSGEPQRISNHRDNGISEPLINNRGQIVWAEEEDGIFSIYLAKPEKLTMQQDPVVNGNVGVAQQKVQDTYKPYSYDPFAFTIDGCKLITPEDLNWDGDLNDPDMDSNKPTFVLIHGWDTDGVDEIWDWDNKRPIPNSDYYNMAKGLKNQANVFIWDWTKLAYSSLLKGPPIKNEQASANYLEKVLTNYFAQQPNYDEPVQFIGHSMGGKVALLAAQDLDGHPFDIEQVSLLDPYNCEDLFNNNSQTHSFDFYVDQYASLVSRMYFGVDLGNYKLNNCFVAGADVNVYLTDVELAGAWDISHDHHEAVAYYMHTIPGIEGYDPDLHGGFAWSIAGTTCPSKQFYFTHTDGSEWHSTTYEPYKAEALADNIRDAINLGNPVSYIADNLVGVDLSVLNLTASSASTTIEWVNKWRDKLTSGSPSYVYQSLTFPENAEFLDLNYTIEASDNDSYVAVLVNDDLLYYASADLNLGRTVDSGNLDISSYAGQTAYLTFLVDDPDSVGGATVYLNNMQILEAYSYNPYEFTFTADGGDTYTGIVYAASDRGYYPGLSWAGSEQGQTGTYEITGVGPGSSDFAEKIGQVFIANYHDTATEQDYTPLEYTLGLPSGTNYLGSEAYRGDMAQVTNNNGAFDVAPQVLDDGRILWQGWDGHDYEIYCLVPGQGLTQFTNNDSPDAMPQMNASGQATWMNWDGQDWEVWYNLGNGPVQLTNNAGAFDVLPQITADAQIYWQGWDGHDYEIYHYNPTTKATTQLTDNALPDAAPEVNASGQLTWMGQDGSSWQVYYNTGSSPVQLTTSGANLSPQITDAGQIYWQGWDGSDYEIYRYTIGSGPTENLTNNTVNDVTPAVKNAVLVWSQWDGSYWQIYQDFLSTGLVTQITNDSYDNKDPRVNANGQIVWMKWDGSDYEIYTYQ